MGLVIGPWHLNKAKFRRTMATKTLMVRPYVFAASTRAASSLFLCQAQQTKPFVSAVQLGSRTRASCTELRVHNDSENISIGEGYGYGRSSGLGFGPVGGRRFSTRATHVNDAGSIDSPLMQSMENKVRISNGYPWKVNIFDYGYCGFIVFVSGNELEWWNNKLCSILLWWLMYLGLNRMELCFVFLGYQYLRFRIRFVLLSSMTVQSKHRAFFFFFFI